MKQTLIELLADQARYAVQYTSAEPIHLNLLDHMLAFPEHRILIVHGGRETEIANLAALRMAMLTLSGQRYLVHATFIAPNTQVVAICSHSASDTNYCWHLS